MAENIYNVVTGVVVNNIDPYGGDRIQVRMGNIHDGTKSDGELIYCSPLMPKLIHVTPKPGELVLIILQKANASDGNRFYIGPVLSQPQRYFHELNNTAKSFLDNPDGDGNTTLETPNKGINIGTVPDETDVSIIGRDNTELRLRERELRLMTGYKKDSQGPVDVNMEFNRIDPAFIQMQWNSRIDNTSKLQDKNYTSSVNIFGDRINLLSRCSDINIGELDNTELITEEKMNELLEKCHPIVYGDKLVEFLKQFRLAFILHTHPFSMRGTVIDANVQQLMDTNFDEMLSKAVKTC